MPVQAMLTNLFESIKTWTETLIYLEIRIIARILVFAYGFLVVLFASLQTIYPFHPLRG